MLPERDIFTKVHCHGLWHPSGRNTTGASHKTAVDRDRERSEGCCRHASCMKACDEWHDLVYLPHALHDIVLLVLACVWNARAGVFTLCTTIMF